MDDGAWTRDDDERLPEDDGRRLTPQQAEELVLGTVQRHAESLLRLARRHSLCVDDAQDAYQRALEIFIRRAPTLDPERAPGWLHTVVKHEAMAVRSSRQKLLGAEEVDLDAHESSRLPSPDEHLLSFDRLTRSAEALQRLKPQEVRALWMKAAGNSYLEIAEATGWTYTKVNRCITEGRRRFLERYAGIEAGDECRRWMPVLAAIADGEATPEQLLDVRPHLRNCPACRSTVRAMRESSRPLAVVLPAAALTTAVGGGGAAPGFLVRLYESLTTAIHERAVAGAVKFQAALDTVASGKVTAAAVTAAAAAGGGLALSSSAHPDPSSTAHRHAHPAARPIAARAAASIVAPSTIGPTLQTASTQRRSTPTRSMYLARHLSRARAPRVTSARGTGGEFSFESTGSVPRSKPAGRSPHPTATTTASHPSGTTGEFGVGG